MSCCQAHLRVGFHFVIYGRSLSIFLVADRPWIVHFFVTALVIVIPSVVDTGSTASVYCILRVLSRSLSLFLSPSLYFLLSCELKDCELVASGSLFLALVSRENWAALLLLMALLATLRVFLRWCTLDHPA